MRFLIEAAILLLILLASYKIYAELKTKIYGRKIN